jgi:peptide/nickel transport system substrate-binding protein
MILAAATACGVALAGCAAAPEPGATAGALGVGLSAPVDCIDPHQTPRTPNLQVAQQLVASLTDQDPDTGEIVPWLAQAWTVDDTATRFTFTLRDGVAFADGTPLDAAAVVANLDDVAGLGARSPLGATYLANYAGATATDPRTVEVRFSAPSAQFLQATAMVTLGLLAPATLALAPERRCAGELIGSGPFVVDEVVPNEEIRLTARSGYTWPSAADDHRGAPRITTLTFAVMTDASARHGSLVSGQLDVDTQVLPQDEPAFGAGGLELVSGTRPGIVYTLLPNETRPALQDPQVRRAIGAAVDRSAFISLLSAAERPATSALASTTPGYADRSELLAHDPAEAARLLDAAGWRRGGDGIREKDGQRLTLALVYSATERYGAVYQLVAQQLADAGIELRLTPLDDAGNNARQAAGDYDLVSWAVTRADPSVLASVFSVTSANPQKRTTPDELDARIAAIATTLDPQQRAAAVDAAVRTIIGAGHGIPLFEQAGSVGIGEGVTGVWLDSAGRARFSGAEVQR